MLLRVLLAAALVGCSSTPAPGPPQPTACDRAIEAARARASIEVELQLLRGPAITEIVGTQLAYAGETIRADAQVLHYRLTVGEGFPDGHELRFRWVHVSRRHHFAVVPLGDEQAVDLILHEDDPVGVRRLLVLGLPLCVLVGQECVEAIVSYDKRLDAEYDAARAARAAEVAASPELTAAKDALLHLATLRPVKLAPGDHEGDVMGFRIAAPERSLLAGVGIEVKSVARAGTRTCSRSDLLEVPAGGKELVAGVTRRLVLSDAEPAEASPAE